MVEGAPAGAELAGLKVAVMSPNRLLAQGLTRQIREAGGDVVDVAVAAGDRVDALLIDGGAGPEPEPVVEPEGAVPAFLLVTPAARSKLEAPHKRGFAGYILKPVRQGALVEILSPLRAGVPVSAAPSPAAQKMPELPPLVVLRQKKYQSRFRHRGRKARWQTCGPPILACRTFGQQKAGPALPSCWPRTIPST